MTNVFIFHGFEANPDANWFPWLKEELEKKGYTVFVPEMPDSGSPKLDAWMKHMEQYKDKIDENTIFVGHSLGCPFILHLLQNLDHPIKAAFLVSAFVGELGPVFDPFIGDISIREFNWEKIRKNCAKFVIINSDNDPYIPLEKAKELHEKLSGSDLKIFPARGHLNLGTGFFTFEELRDAILQV